MDRPTRHRTRRRRHSRGQSLAEIAIAMPLFTVLTLGVADGGRAFSYRESVTNAARQALRAAAADSIPDTVRTSAPVAGGQACSALGTSGTTRAVSVTVHVPWSSTTDSAYPYMRTIADAAALESSSDGTTSGSRISGASMTVTWHCSGLSAVTNATNTGVTDPALVASDAVEVRISDGMTLITPLVTRLFGSGAPQIVADVTGRVEY